MRAFASYCVVALMVGASVVGCGSVKDNKTPDGGTMPDASTSGCTANAMLCGSDNALYMCDADGAAQTKVQDCANGCTVDHCNECAANTMFCDGNDLATCSAAGEITNPMSCQFGCQMDRCNTCEPGVAYCNGTTAVTCGADGTPASMMACGGPGCNGGVCNSCTPNTLSCQGDTLVNCNASGAVASTTSCALGCSTTGTAHCKALVPSYGVPAPTGTLPDLNVDATSTLDISNCSMSPASVDLTINGVTTSLVGSPQVFVKAQSGGPPICIVRFGKITIQSGFQLTISNSADPGHVLSLQATGDVQIDGVIAFNNAANGPAPGASVASLGPNANNKTRAPGGGGAGAARAGGNGGQCTACPSNVPGGAGGAAVTNITTVFNGGSRGGLVDTVGGGLGGGGLQIVSLTKVLVGATGKILLNGGGGYGTILGWMASGAGSGGTLVIEAPVVSVSAGGLAAANGGGGAGGCTGVINIGGFPRPYHINGQSGQQSAARAAGGDCTNSGDGGYEANGMTAPSINGSPSDADCATGDGGGGGASSGFIFLRGRAAASVMINAGAVVSPTPTTGAVTAN